MDTVASGADISCWKMNSDLQLFLGLIQKDLGGAWEEQGACVRSSRIWSTLGTAPVCRSSESGYGAPFTLLGRSHAALPSSSCSDTQSNQIWTVLVVGWLGTLIDYTMAFSAMFS